ncbi:MAG: hotdog fold thioesterase [Balneolaceae bacterium]
MTTSETPLPSIAPNVKEKFEAMLQLNRPTMGDALGLRFITVSKEEMRASMPVNEQTIQPFGILHGGASVALAETLASIGAYLNLDHPDHIAVGLEINANHIKSVRKGGTVVGISRPIHRGAQTQVWETRIETKSGKLVSISRCTLAVVSRK